MAFNFGNAPAFNFDNVPAFNFDNVQASNFGNNSAVSPNALAQTAPDLEEIQTEVSSSAN